MVFVPNGFSNSWAFLETDTKLNTRQLAIGLSGISHKDAGRGQRLETTEDNLNFKATKSSLDDWKFKFKKSIANILLGVGE